MFAPANTDGEMIHTEFYVNHRLQRAFAVTRSWITQSTQRDASCCTAAVFALVFASLYASAKVLCIVMLVVQASTSELSTTVFTKHVVFVRAFSDTTQRCLNNNSAVQATG